MPASTTLTIRLTPEANEQLSHLAHVTDRSKSFLAAEAISKYVSRELEIVEGIERGLADVKAGRLVPHDEAMARLENTIAVAEQGKV
jgi:predicted transcriptional regulator